MKTTPNPTKSAHEQHQAALQAVSEWERAIADLRHQLALASERQPATPADLAEIADDQVNLERRIALAEASLEGRRAAVLEAAKTLVLAEAGALQGDIDQARGTVAGIDAQTAELRQALDAHLSATATERAEAEKVAAETSRLQAGLRAAVNGDGLREYFPRLGTLPALLHPVTGVLPQVSYQADIDQAAEQEAYQQHLADGQRVLDQIGAALGLSGLRVAMNDLWRAEQTWIDSRRISAEAYALEYDEPKHLELFEQAAEHADSESFARVAECLEKATDRRRARDRKDAR